ncbi:MAG: lipoprotein [Nitrosomonas sp.]|nr:lipoprotein [Nitrosomonas sp.]
MRLFITLLLATYLFSGCGLKGPLYLPQTDEPNRTSTNETEKK